MESKRDILLVEDDPNDIDLVRRVLRRLGFESRLEVCVDGAEAMQVLENRVARGALPRVVLLDLKLPGLSGVEVLRRIRSIESLVALPVVVLTSSMLGSDVDACYEIGANSYVVKPVDPDEFRRVVETLGIYWADINQVAVGG